MVTTPMRKRSPTQMPTWFRELPNSISDSTELDIAAQIDKFLIVDTIID